MVLAASAGALAQTPPSPTAPSAVMPFVTPQAFGARGDGAADDTVALAAALGSGHPVWCAGRFRITAPVVTATPPGGVYALLGAGRPGCEIVLATPLARLEADIAGTAPDDNHSRLTAQLVMHDVAITPLAALTGHARPAENAAMSAVFATSGDATSGRVDIRNVAVLPRTGAGWAKYGLYLERARTAAVDGLRCTGAQAYFYDAGSACLYIHGSAPIPPHGADIPAGLLVTHLAAYNNQFGLLTDGHVEGVILDDSEVVGGQTGARIGDDAGTGSTLFQAAHNEINVTDVGFDVVNDVRLQIHDNHIFLGAPADNGRDAICIRLVNARDAVLYAQVHDNLCEGYARTVAGGRRRIGLAIESPGTLTSQRGASQVHDNIFAEVDVGISLGPTINTVDIGCNTYLPAGGAPLADVLDANPRSDPALVNRVRCADGAAHPSP